MVILTSITDTYVNEVSSARRGDSTTLALRTGGAGDVFGLIKMGSTLGTPANATIQKDDLRLYNTEDWSGSVTLTIERVTSKWGVNATWANRPSVTATGAVSVTKSDATAGTEWLFDLASLTQTAIGLGKFYGFRISVSGSTVRRVYSTNSTHSAFKPTFDLDWSVPPAAPSRLNPSLGKAVSTTTPTFQFDYTDRSTGAAMTAYQLQLNYTTDDFSSPDIDTGEVSSDAPERTFGSALTASTAFYWRVRVKNSWGDWSDWSESTASIVTAKGTLTIDIPGDSPADVVAEYTPPKGWTFTGTQTAFQVVDTDSVVTSRVYADSLRTPGTDDTYTSNVPQVFTGGIGRTVVRVWDDVDRAETPGDPAYVEAVRMFSLAFDSGVAPVSGLTVTVTPMRPEAVLNWSRSTAPDKFQIVRSDGYVVDVDAIDALVSGTAYQWTDVTAPPHHELTWTVLAVVNGAASDDAPTATDTIEPIYIWLLDPLEPDWSLALAGQDDSGWAMGEESEVHEILGSDRVVPVYGAIRGYEDSISGGIYSDLPGVNLTAQAARDLAWHVRQNRTRVFRLVLSDINIPVAVRNFVIKPTPYAELQYGCSFSFYQQGELAAED